MDHEIRIPKSAYASLQALAIVVVLILIFPFTGAALLVLMEFVAPQSNRGANWLLVIFGSIAMLVMMVIMAALYRASRVIRTAEYWKTMRLKSGRCPSCEYPITGLPSPRCPECGCTWSDEDAAD